jgi:predicted dehydrogenase
MGTLRCGVSGLGRGRIFVEKLNATPDCEVVAVCDPNPRALEPFAGLDCYADYERMLAEAHLDLVAVISPGPDHAPQSLLALEHGVHVLSETPCVYALDEAAAIVAAVRRTGLRYMLSEDYVTMGWVQRLRELVDSGELGEIVAGQAEYTHDCRGIFAVDAEGRYLPWSEHGRADARPSWRASHLPPLSYCSHTLGPLLYLMGDRCITACGLDAGSRTFPEAGTIDFASAVLKTAGGRVIALSNGFGVAHPFIYLLGLYGTRGSVRCMSYSFGEPEVRVYLDRDGGGWQEMPMRWFERPDGRDWLLVMLEGFVDSIRRGTEPPMDVFDAMDFTVPGLCAHLSAAQGGVPVAVPDYRQTSL